MAPLDVEPVEQAGVEVTGVYFWIVEQLEQEALVRGPAVDHRNRVRERPAHARERFVTVAAPCDQLADRGSNSAGIQSPSVTPVSTRRPGPVGSLQVDEPPGRGHEPEGRVLRAEADLDRVPGRRRRVAVEPPTRRDVQLKLDEVEPGHRLGDGMLDPEAGVHLQEREAVRCRVVQELHRRCVSVARALRQPPAPRP